MLQTKPDAKIAMLYQNDDFGKDLLKGVKDGLGADHAKMIVKEATYEVTEPTIDSQVLTLQGSGADIFVIAATPKFAAQAIRKAYDSAGSRCASSTTSRLDRLGAEAGRPREVEGPHHRRYYKDPNDPQWKDDAGMQRMARLRCKYYGARTT